MSLNEELHRMGCTATKQLRLLLAASLSRIVRCKHVHSWVYALVNFPTGDHSRTVGRILGQR
eukprot:3457809-Amphidinium_carterae.1